MKKLILASMILFAMSACDDDSSPASSNSQSTPAGGDPANGFVQIRKNKISQLSMLASRLVRLLRLLIP